MTDFDPLQSSTNMDHKARNVTSVSGSESVGKDSVTGDGNSVGGMEDDAYISHLARDMFEKTKKYLDGELAASIEEYKLLEEMNVITTSKFSDMRHIASNVSKSLNELNEKYRSLQPYLEQIEQMEASVLKLEQAAYKLDAYSKRLEAKFKQLEKR